jgi:hypothetical protein
MGLWLVGYALIFGSTLAALAGHWHRRRPPQLRARAGRDG